MYLKYAKKTAKLFGKIQAMRVEILEFNIFSGNMVLCT